MNRKNLKRLIERLESPENPVSFNMDDFFQHNNIYIGERINILNILATHPCGTVACLAGHAAIIAWSEDNFEYPYIEPTAQEWLELSDDEAEKLFYRSWARPSEEGMKGITKQEAIEHLYTL